MFRFSSQGMCFFGALVSLFWLPDFRELILGRVLGLGRVLSDTIAPALNLGALVGVSIGYSALSRGLSLGEHRSRSIALSAVLRAIVVVSVSSLTLLDEEFNGAVIGVLAMIAAFSSEAVLLGTLLLRKRGGG